MIKRSKCENKGIVPTEMELVLEYTQQGASHEVIDIRVIRRIKLVSPPGKNTMVQILRESNLFLHKKLSDIHSFKDGVEMEIPSSSDPGAGMLTRAMAKELSAASAHECLFVDFLSEEEPKKIKQSERGISINQEKYVKDLLKKYDINGSSIKTSMVPPNNLGPDLNSKAVNETQYRANPKESHLIAVKRIFKYLKDRKSTLGACQLLGGKLICWSAKKHQSVAMSSLEAEYVAADGCHAGNLTCVDWWMDMAHDPKAPNNCLGIGQD
ncbi:hypothetical protein Tco_0886837 [Tanacetum coccineum]